MSHIEINKPVDIGPVETTGAPFSSRDYRGRNIVLYFYPKDNTPGCTTESRDFTACYEQFREYNTEIFGISRDSLHSHNRFRNKLDMPFDLISDTDEQLCRAFGVLKEKNMFGKKVMGIQRSTFLINREGILVKEWRNVKVPGHVAEVLEAVKQL